MADLKVSYDRLEESNRNLKAINTELDTMCAHQSDISGSLGSGDMAHAMHDFGNNWDYHRHKLQGNIKALGEMTEQVMQQFREVDHKLAAGFKDEKKK
ncbi:hypothetical protein POF50_023400 [Streptomyces sp. SL13]|jgi:hypothetical protein|uniref:Uncharacterized protein n=1 Tax=Streptantibioticus silvisoli TaxID=2705255 RepID=A0AA90HAX6_9ACTN|nr:hypothetical protein [Streptantibioticus silvisoli]MDI5966677.1 hypothetical protein [Streptantibioticus silvisoli]MDI5972245.1 hypothetical protein [Streptantibioticus silvisoli]